MKNIALVILLILLTNCGTKSKMLELDSKPEFIPQNLNYKGFTLEESRNYHKHFVKNNWGESGYKWSNGGEISRYIFLHLSEFWPHSVINRSHDIIKLPIELREDVASFITNTRLGKLSLKDYVEKSTSDGVIILHRGKIVFEEYPRMFSTDKHIYFSVSKTFVSTAVAILEDRGLIDVTKSIDFYFTELKESDWEGIPVIDILDMSSGMNCLFDFEDSKSCFLETWRAYGWPVATDGLEDPIDKFRTVSSQRPSGQIFEYADINPLILTLLVEKLSGLAFAEFMEKEIWQKIGAEADALMLNAAYGRSATPLGISSRLRDMGRYGMLFSPSGISRNEPVLSEAYIKKIQKGGRPKLFNHNWPDKFEDGSIVHNTYLWDYITKDGDFFKSGHAGQGLYVSPGRDLVIAFFGTMNEDGVENQMPAICRQLVNAGFFDK